MNFIAKVWDASNTLDRPALSALRLSERMVSGTGGDPLCAVAVPRSVADCLLTTETLRYTLST